MPPSYKPCQLTYQRVAYCTAIVVTRTMTGAPERQEDLYAECDQIFLRIHRKKNAKRPDQPWESYLKKVFRKPIETQFSQITNRFGRHIHAVSPEGLLLKLFLFVFAFSLDGITPDSD